MRNTYHIDGTIDHKLVYDQSTLHRLDGPAVELDNVLVWFQNGKVHRDDGPAIVYLEWGDTNPNYDTIEEWHQYGILHRTTGPAIIYVNGSYEWVQNGRLHREDGPAQYWSPDSSHHWYILGEEITQEIFEKMKTCSNINKLADHLVSASPAERYLAEKRITELENKI